jgi:hypothetical protein
MLLIPTFAFALDKSNPADFPITVHVVSSRSRSIPSQVHTVEAVQYLETMIDKQPVEIGCESEGVLALGDYPARVSTKIHSPSKHPNTYDIYSGYDLLMPNQSIRTWLRHRLGADACHESVTFAIPSKEPMVFRSSSSILVDPSASRHDFL